MDQVVKIRTGDEIHCDRAKLTERAVIIRRHGAWIELRPPQWSKVLLDAKEKLALYRAAHGGEYVGGVEYSALIGEINELLSAD